LKVRELIKINIFIETNYVKIKLDINLLNQKLIKKLYEIFNE